MDRLLKCCWVCRKRPKKVQPAVLNPNEIVLESKGVELGKRSSSATALGRSNEVEAGNTVVAHTYEKVERAVIQNKPLNEYVFPRLALPMSLNASFTC